MKSVIISIQPQWCEPISTGLKYIEIRKTRPTVELPIKVYIYATKSDKYLLDQEPNGNLFCWDKKSHHYPFKYEENFVELYNGKVIGEFICDRIDEYESEFVNDDCLETVHLIDRDECEHGDYQYCSLIWSNEGDNYNFSPYDEIIKGSRVSYKELKKYIGLGVKTFYGWHISDLAIYDEPKKLWEFRNIKGEPIKRPFQSWGYAEKL